MGSPWLEPPLDGKAQAAHFRKDLSQGSRSQLAARTTPRATLPPSSKPARNDVATMPNVPQPEEQRILKGSQACAKNGRS